MFICCYLYSGAVLSLRSKMDKLEKSLQISMLLKDVVENGINVWQNKGQKIL